MPIWVAMNISAACSHDHSKADFTMCTNTAIIQMPTTAHSSSNRSGAAALPGFPLYCKSAPSSGQGWNRQGVGGEYRDHGLYESLGLAREAQRDAKCQQGEQRTGQLHERGGRKLGGDRPDKQAVAD